MRHHTILTIGDQRLEFQFLEVIEVRISLDPCKTRKQKILRAYFHSCVDQRGPDG